MVRNHKVTGTAMPMALGLALGVGIALLVLTISVALIAWMALGEKIPVPAVGYTAMAAHLLSVCVGGFVASAAIKHRKMIVCLIVGGAYYLCLIGCTAMFFGGQYNGLGVTLLIVAGASGLIGWLTSRGDNTGRKRYKKYRNR